MKSVLDAEQLIQLQIELEYGLDTEGKLVPVPGSTERARFIAYRHAGGERLFFGHDLPAADVRRISSLPPEAPFEDEEAVRSVLAAHRPVSAVFHGESCAFEALPSPKAGPATRLDSSHLPFFEASDIAPLTLNGYFIRLCIPGRAPPPDRPVFGVIEGGKVVSLCESARENALAAECWVRTLPRYARRGFATAAVRGWAAAVMAAGKTPFYSYAAGNPASKALARHLGLEPFAQVAGYD